MKKTIFVVIASLLLVVGIAKALTMTTDEFREFLRIGDNPPIEEEDSRVGSVAVTGEYMATSVSPHAMPPKDAFIETSTSPFVIKKGRGTFGSYIVGAAGGAGSVSFYDATTTNINLRNSVASSTLLLGAIPMNASAGTYVFDVWFNHGLIMVWQGGSIGTSTITYR